MSRKTLVSLVALLVVVGLVAAQAKDAKKDDKKDTSTPITAKVTKVDAVKNVVTVEKDGKKMELAVTDDTKIVGPRGGVSKDRLKDDRLAVGAEVKVLMDGKKVKEIQLPMRKSGGK